MSLSVKKSDFFRKIRCQLNSDFASEAAFATILNMGRVLSFAVFFRSNYFQYLTFNFLIIKPELKIEVNTLPTLAKVLAHESHNKPVPISLTSETLHNSAGGFQLDMQPSPQTVKKGDKEEDLATYEVTKVMTSSNDSTETASTASSISSTGGFTILNVTADDDDEARSSVKVIDKSKEVKDCMNPLNHQHLTCHYRRYVYTCASVLRLSRKIYV